jgi:hypothetical protein
MVVGRHINLPTGDASNVQQRQVGRIDFSQRLGFQGRERDPLWDKLQSIPASSLLPSPSWQGERVVFGTLHAVV